MMLFSFLALLAQDVPRKAIPIEQLNSHGRTFTCFEAPGLPTLSLVYGDGLRLIRFTYTHGDEQIVLAMTDAVKTAFYEKVGDEQHWIIHAEGVPEHPEGVAAGTSATIDLVIRLDAGGSLTGDFTAKAGAVSKTYARCQQGPSIVRAGTPQ